MNENTGTRNMAVYCDFENVALGVRDAKYAAFDIQKVLAKRKEIRTSIVKELDGQRVRIPGYFLPLEVSDTKVTEFLLVPYVGACIHVPPPPPNQLVFVTTETPSPGDQLWDAVWVTGHMRTQLQSTELAQTGYTLSADAMEVYEW